MGIVVGIGGVSCGGKTTLARRLKKELESPPDAGVVTVLHQDDFYKDEATLFREGHPYDEQLRYHNWELPGAFDAARLHERLDGATGLTLVEGILVTEDEGIVDTAEVVFFLDCSREVCSERRIKRNYEPPEPEGYFDKYYWPSYLSIKAKAESLTESGRAVVFLDATESIETLTSRMTKDVTEVLTRKRGGMTGL